SCNCKPRTGNPLSVLQRASVQLHWKVVAFSSVDRCCPRPFAYRGSTLWGKHCDGGIRTRPRIRSLFQKTLCCSNKDHRAPSLPVVLHDCCGRIPLGLLGILTVILYLPVVMAIPTFLLGKKWGGLSKILGIGTTAVVFSISLINVGLFQYGNPGFQLTDTGEWASTFGLNYIVAIDGISLPLLILAAFLCLLAAAGSRDMISSRQPEYYALFLIFETGIIGVFTSLNLILFYVFWEIVLIPMFFFIGIWGGPRRKYASLKFLIFTYAGSAIMLFGFVALYAWTGSQGT